MKPVGEAADDGELEASLVRTVIRRGRAGTCVLVRHELTLVDVGRLDVIGIRGIGRALRGPGWNAQVELVHQLAGRLVVNPNESLLPHLGFTREGDGEMCVGIHVDTSIGRKELVFTLCQHGQHSHKTAHHT